MKKCLLLVLIFLGSITVCASVRTPDAAAVIAQQFVSGNRSWSAKRSVAKPMQLVYTVEQANSNPAAYVFSHGRGNGFVIVSADDACRPILGYADRGEWNSSILPENMRHWLEHYADEIALLQGNATYQVTMPQHKSATAITVNGQQTNAKDYTTPTKVYHVDPAYPYQPIPDSLSIKPLLGEIAWGQSWPYNVLCPHVPIDTTSRCLTGCVATATSQIMRYWSHPASGTGSHSYYWEDGGDTLSASFEHYYDWSNILPTYQSEIEYPQTQVTAVATLLYDVGIALEMQYGVESGTSSKKIPSALQTYFGYDRSMINVHSNFIDTQSLASAIKGELLAGRPVLLVAYSLSEGHCCVCDGCDSTGLFHINWGWYGECNGYFVLSVLDPLQPGHEGSKSTDGYHYNINAYKNIFPDAGNPVTPPQLGVLIMCTDKNEVHVGDSITINAQWVWNYGSTDWQGDIVMAVLDSTDVIATIGQGLRDMMLMSDYYFNDDIVFADTLPSLADGKYTLRPIYSVGDKWYDMSTVMDLNLRVHGQQANFYIGDKPLTQLHYTTSNKKALTIEEEVFDATILFHTYLNGQGTIMFLDTLREIRDGAFATSTLATITIPSTVTTIGNFAFADADLVAITIPDNVQNVGLSIFTGCDSLESIVGPVQCFYYDDILNQISGPANLQRVVITHGEMSEAALTALQLSYRTLRTIDVSNAMNTTLSDEAFRGCYNLDTLRLPACLEYVPYKAVAECTNLRSICIPSSVVEIGPSAFSNCRSLQCVQFGDSAVSASSSLRRIDEWAFYNAHALKYLTLPAGVEEIGDGAFFGCHYLDSLCMPASVHSIGDNAFALCARLGAMRVDALTPPDIASKTFLDVNRHIPVYVPLDAVEAYQAHPLWSEFDIRGRKMTTSLPCVGGQDAMTHDKYISNGIFYIRRGDKVYTLWGTEVR